MSGIFPILDATAREGQRFSDNFFDVIDKRGSPPQSITPETTIVWNGSPLVGSEAFSEMILASPTTRHEITGLDVHPFPHGDQQAVNMMIMLSGKVSYGGSGQHNMFGFSAQIVARRPQAQAPFILQTMAYRLVHAPADSKVKMQVV